MPGKDRPRDFFRKSFSRSKSPSGNARAGEELANLRAIKSLFGGRIHQSVENIRRHIKKLIHATVFKFDFESFRMLLVTNLCNFLGGNWDPTHFLEALSGERRFHQTASGLAILSLPLCCRVYGL